jgi:tRNA-specific 2-thiouridylase
MYKMVPHLNSKICLALSGGIDSTFAGWLLKRKGYELTGVYLNIIDNDENLANVKFTADSLGIPLKILDLRSQFYTHIVQPFIKGYLLGQTPNPCVFCNAIIKCGLLLDWALENGFFYLATGHYAQIKKDPETGNHLLLRGIDLQKDQSYFLYRLTQKQLSRLVLPLGHWIKKDVEDYVKEIGLITPNKIQESQEICFLSSKDYRIFLKQVAPNAFRPGPVYDKSGNRLGSHSGLPNYTIGQRKGLQLIKHGPNYVLSVDPKKNSVIVGNDEDLWQSMLVANKINRIISQWPKKVLAKIRSTQPAKEATLEEIGTSQVKILFSNPVRAITPGQSVVFYQGEICIGGGIILKYQPPFVRFSLH